MLYLRLDPKTTIRAIHPPEGVAIELSADVESDGRLRFLLDGVAPGDRLVVVRANQVCPVPVLARAVRFSTPPFADGDFFAWTKADGPSYRIGVYRFRRPRRAGFRSRFGFDVPGDCEVLRVGKSCQLSVVSCQ